MKSYNVKKSCVLDKTDGGIGVMDTATASVERDYADMDHSKNESVVMSFAFNNEATYQIVVRQSENERDFSIEVQGAQEIEQLREALKFFVEQL